MKFGTFPLATPPRTEVRAMLVQYKAVPADYLDEVTDLAIHAAERGARALLETIDHSGSLLVKLTAVGIATAILRNQLEVLDEGLVSAAATIPGAKVIKNAVIKNA